MFTITNNNEEMLFTIEAEDSLVYFFKISSLLSLILMGNS